MAALWAGHLPGRPGQTAHFHGREGTFSLPPIQPPSATPWLSSVLAPSSRARLVPVYLRQAPPGPTQLQEASRQQLSENPEAACKTAMLALSLVILSLLSAVLPASCQQGSVRWGWSWWFQGGGSGPGTGGLWEDGVVSQYLPPHHLYWKEQEWASQASVCDRGPVGEMLTLGSGAGSRIPK